MGAKLAHPIALDEGAAIQGHEELPVRIPDLEGFLEGHVHHTGYLVQEQVSLVQEVVGVLAQNLELVNLLVQGCDLAQDPVGLVDRGPDLVVEGLGVGFEPLDHPAQGPSQGARRLDQGLACGGALRVLLQLLHGVEEVVHGDPNARLDRFGDVVLDRLIELVDLVPVAQGRQAGPVLKVQELVPDAHDLVDLDAHANLTGAAGPGLSGHRVGRHRREVHPLARVSLRLHVRDVVPHGLEPEPECVERTLAHLEPVKAVQHLPSTP